MIEKAILCIDDEKTILNSLQSQLQRNFGDDFIYEFAEDAEEGFEIIDELIESGTTVLIIVSDWLMPGMKGDEFLVKVHEQHPEITKVLLTGQADNDAIENAYKNASLHKHILKPWDEEELIGVIKTGLNSN